MRAPPPRRFRGIRVLQATHRRVFLTAERVRNVVRDVVRGVVRDMVRNMVRQVFQSNPKSQVRDDYDLVISTQKLCDD